MLLIWPAVYPWGAISNTYGLSQWYNIQNGRHHYQILDLQHYLCITIPTNLACRRSSGLGRTHDTPEQKGISESTHCSAFSGYIYDIPGSRHGFTAPPRSTTCVVPPTKKRHFVDFLHKSTTGFTPTCVFFLHIP